MKQFLLTTLVFLLFVSSPYAQISSAGLREALNHPASTSHFISLSRLRLIYTQRDYRPLWTRPKDIRQLNAFIDSCEFLGLNKNEYQCGLVDSVRLGNWRPRTISDSILVELKLTDLALDFFTDIAAGNAVPHFAYAGLKRTFDESNLISRFSTSFEEDKFASLIAEMQPQQRGYQNLKLLMNKFQAELAEPSFIDVRVKSNRADSSNISLLRRLKQLGVGAPEVKSDSANEIIERIKVVQRMLDLPANGVLTEATLKEMNISLAYRVNELKTSLNLIRWFTATSSFRSAVIVNIPSATLLLYENGELTLQSKVIVGKKSNPTPTISSNITEVILYPYWMIPKKIATRELLPLIKKDIGYLDANGIQVINKQGRVISPYVINWNELSSSNFPYLLRQSTGCDNSLGLVKLNFNNPFSVYLHDTPWKGLFTFRKRYFSHGCIRVEKAIELARLLLKGNEQAIDTVTEKGCLKNQSPISIPATRSIPVFVLYQTAWIDVSANVIFHEDVYGRLIERRKQSKLTNKSIVSK